MQIKIIIPEGCDSHPPCVKPRCTKLRRPYSGSNPDTEPPADNVAILLSFVCSPSFEMLPIIYQSLYTSPLYLISLNMK